LIVLIVRRLAILALLGSMLAELSSEDQSSEVQ
jgi:hypothetical protein